MTTVKLIVHVQKYRNFHHITTDIIDGNSICNDHTKQILYGESMSSNYGVCVNHHVFQPSLQG